MTQDRYKMTQDRYKARYEIERKDYPIKHVNLEEIIEDIYPYELTSPPNQTISPEELARQEYRHRLAESKKPRNAPILVHEYGSAFEADAKGLTEVLLSQFDDPMLCFRELVQNSIDANSTKVKIDFGYDYDKHLLSVDVVDNGEGMGLEKVLRYLTLFDSTKEMDVKKIGEMGAGKVFALTLKPKPMIIDTGDGQEGYRLIFNEDNSGRILKINPIKGTKVKLIIPMEELKAQEFMIETKNIVKKWCRYVKTPIYVDGKKINKNFDIPHLPGDLVTRVDKPGLEAVFRFGSINTYGPHSFFKGRILLQEDERFPRFKNVSGNILNMFDILVNADKFKFPLSRNGIVYNDDFWDIQREMLGHVVSLTPRIISEYVKAHDAYVKSLKELTDLDLVREKFKKARKTGKHPKEEIPSFFYFDSYGEFLRLILADGGYSRLEDDTLTEIEKLPLFKTVNQDYVSFRKLRATIARDGYLYYTSKLLSTTELSAFEEKDIPVLLAPDTVVKDHIFNGCNKQSLDSGYYFKDSSWEMEDRTLIDDVCNLYHHWRFPNRSKETYSESTFSKSEYKPFLTEGQEMRRAEAREDEFKLSSLNLSCFPFVDFSGNPEKNVFLKVDYGLKNDSRDDPEKYIYLNKNHPFMKSMLKLAKKDRNLAAYFTLAELVKSKQAFEDVSDKAREDKIIEIGSRIAENGN